jgi:hypothetical protein
MRIAIVIYCVALIVFLFSLTLRAELRQQSRPGFWSGKPKPPMMGDHTRRR